MCIRDSTYERAYNHVAAARVEVDEVITEERDFPVGTYLVPTAQYLGRLAAHMLEPETDDNVIYWNTMDAWLPRPNSQAARLGGLPTGPGGPAPEEDRGPLIVPIYKLMESVTLNSRVIEEPY